MFCRRLGRSVFKTPPHLTSAATLHKEKAQKISFPFKVMAFALFNLRIFRRHPVLNQKLATPFVANVYTFTKQQIKKGLTLKIKAIRSSDMSLIFIRRKGVTFQKTRLLFFFSDFASFNNNVKIQTHSRFLILSRLITTALTCSQQSEYEHYYFIGCCNKQFVRQMTIFQLICSFSQNKSQ